MNADQGFRRPPGNLLRVAAGAGAAVLIAAAASAARRARTATADRGSGSAHDQVSPSDVPVPEVPEAVKACDPAVGQVAISAALLLVSVTALSAVAGRRRGGGKRGAAHARTPGRQAENGDDVLAPEIPADSGDPWITGAPWSGRQEPAWHDADQSWYDGLRGQHTDDYPSWPGRPGPNALHPDHPSWGGGVPTRAGIARRRRCGRTATPAGRSPRPRRGPTPNRRRRTAVPDGAAEDPRDKNRRPGLTAARPVGQAPLLLRAMPPGQARLPIQDPGPRAGYAPQGVAPHGFAPQPGNPPGPGPARPGPAPRADVPRHGPALQHGATGVMERVRPEAGQVREAGRGQSDQGQVWDAASVELATWIISEANQQATEIRHEARDDAATARTDAKQEAARLVQQAADQAAATLAAAELQAAKIRAGILKLSADLGGVATNFTEDLLSPAKPATKPAADPAAKPRAQAAAGVAPPFTEPGGPFSRRAGGQASHQAGHEASGPAGHEASNPVSRCPGHEARRKPQADKTADPGPRQGEKPAGQRGAQGDGRFGGPDLGWHRHRSYGGSPARTGLLRLPGQRGGRVANRSQGRSGPGPA